MPPALVPLTPKSSVPRELLEEITGCKVLTHIVEDGSKPGDGYMSILYSVTAEVVPKGKSESDKETRHYLLKCYPNHPARQGYLNKTNIFYNELRFYVEWAKELVEFQTRDVGIPQEKVIMPAFPPCEGGKAINYLSDDVEPDALTKVYNPLDNFIMMTDLRKTWDFKMADRRKGFEVEHVQLAFTELATIHALSWAYKNTVEMDLIKKFPFLKVPFGKEDMEMWSNILQGNVETAVATLDSALGKGNVLSKSTRQFHLNAMKIIEFFIEQGDDAEQLFWELHRDPPKDLVEASENEEPWRVINHGDSWCNNMLFKHDAQGKPERIMLIDFQITRDACPTADLVYLVYTSTSAALRKAHLDELLQLYCDKFVEVCATLKVEPLPGFGIETLKVRFHRSKLMGYMMALMGLPLMLAEEGTSKNLDHMDKNADIEGIFIEAFGSGGASSSYAARLVEVAQDLYDQGVI